VKLIDFIKYAEPLLKEVSQFPKKEAEFLVFDAIQKKDYSYFLSEEEFSLCDHFLKRRLTGEPLAYIKGETSFYGCSLFVTKDVLIPRQETELLVDLIVKELVPGQPLEVFDVCTGSGCIGIALKKACPFLNVTLSDVCEKALAVAKENAIRNGVEVLFLQGDLLEPFKGKKCDLLVSNPPYIAEEEIFSLDPQVKEFEPLKALVAKKNGLEFYEAFAKGLPNILSKKAKVYFEIGYNQEKPLFSLFSDPYWRKKRCLFDLANHPRFFSLEIE
jgi:release factor glutamine methyltransferase